MHEFSSCPEELISRMKLMQSPSEDIENMEKMESKARIFLKKFLGLELRIEPMADIVSEDAGISKWTATRLLKRMIGDARRDYEERAEGGCTDSYYRIGRMYRLGIGDDVSNDKAAEYFEIAAERDHAQAQLELANMMYTDPVLGVQTKRAGELYSKAAEHGIADAYVCLSGYYAMGLAGFPHSNQDCDRCWSIAAAKYEKGAFEGDAYSQYRYSRMFHRKVCLSKSDSKSESESARWCRMAAEQELADAQYELGEKYYFGKGVQKSSAKAIEWYTRAGRQGHVDAQRTLGLIYMEGQSVPVDFQKAVKWYKMAADQGDALSQCDLGDYYCRQGDQQNNYKTAVELYMRGAEKGYGASEYRMG